MRKSDSHSNILNFRPSIDELCATINALAVDSENISFGRHTEDRMAERGISTLDALRVMRVGMIEGDIEAGRSEGEWKCKIVARIKGSREIGVVSVVVNRQRIFVKTVEWEDPK